MVRTEEGNDFKVFMQVRQAYCRRCGYIDKVNNLDNAKEELKDHKCHTGGSPVPLPIDNNCPDCTDYVNCEKACMTPTKPEAEAQKCPECDGPIKHLTYVEHDGIGKKSETFGWGCLNCGVRYSFSIAKDGDDIWE